MYKLIAIVSVLVRQFILSNPFEQLPNGLCINVLGTPIIVPPVVVNILMEPLLSAITFTVAGIYYTKHVDNPAEGSFLYLLFYCIHVVLLSVMARFQFATLVVVLIVIGYVGCNVFAIILKNKVSAFI